MIPLIRRRLRWADHCVLATLVLGVLIPWLWLGDTLLYQYAVQRGQQMVTNMGVTAGGQALSPALHRWFVSGAFIGVSSSGDWSDGRCYLPSFQTVVICCSWSVWLGGRGLALRHNNVHLDDFDSFIVATWMGSLFLLATNCPCVVLVKAKGNPKSSAFWVYDPFGETPTCF